MQGLKKYRIGLVVLAPLLLGAAAYEGGEDSPYTRLSLSGVGYDTQPTAYLSLRASTQTFSTSPSGAMREDAAKMERLRAKLRRLGVNEDDFQTSDFQFTKANDPDYDGSPPRRGHMVRHTMTIIMRSPDKAGEAMDALVDVGADNLQVSHARGYSREVNPDSLRRARADAIKDAQAKAADYAKALGMRIRRIVSISEGSGYVTDRPVPAARLAAETGTQIDTRAATVQASVNIVYEMER